MALDPVPWIVGGGAVHSPAVARTLAYVALGGKDGVASPTDLKVQQLAAPGGSVRVGVGAFSINNTYPGQSGQAYVGRATSETVLAVTPTGGAIRSDMVIARIDDPEYGGTSPVDPAVGPYNSLQILTNVGATATEVPAEITYPAIALARIDIPVSTSVITDAMITNLRAIPQAAGTGRVVKTAVRTGDQSLTNTTADGDKLVNTGFSVLVPSWATKAVVIAQVTGARFASTNHSGHVWVQVGEVGSAGAQKTTEARFDDQASGGITRNTLMAAGEVPLAASMRGTVINVAMRYRKASGTGAAPIVGVDSPMVIDVQFVEESATS